MAPLNLEQPSCSSEWELTVSGKPAHSSQIFREDIGYGAALEISRILDLTTDTVRERERLAIERLRSLVDAE